MPEFMVLWSEIHCGQWVAKQPPTREQLQAREKGLREREKEFTSLKEGWDKMMAAGKDHESQIAKLKADLAAQQKLSKKLSTSNKAKDAKIKELEAKLAALQAATADTEDMRRELESSKEAAASFEGQLKAAEGAREAAAKEAQEQAASVKLLEEQVAAMQAAADASTQRLKDALNNMESNHKVLSDKESTLAAKEEELNRLGDNLQEAQTETHTVTERLKDALSDKEETHMKLVAVEAAFMNANQSAAALRTKLAADAKTAASDRQRLQEALESAKAATSAAVADGDAKLAAARASWEAESAAAQGVVEDRLAACHAEIKSMTAEMNASLSREESWKADAKRWQQEAAALAVQRDEEAAAVRGSRAEVESAHKENADLRAQLEAALAAAQQMGKERDVVVTTAESLQGDLQAARDRIAEGEDTMARMAAKQEQMTASRVRRAARAAAMHKRVTELEEELAAAREAKADDLLDATAAAQETIDSKNEEIRVLRMMLEAAKLNAETHKRGEVKLKRRLQTLAAAHPSSMHSPIR